MQIINGVSYNVTAPVKYSMQYAFEKVVYNEPFVIIDFSKAAAQQYLDTFDNWVHGISAFFLGTGATGAAATFGISAGVCAAIAGIVEFAGNAIKGWAINDDGSVSLCLSYHYAGTRKGGMDLTAVPLPGLDPNEWYRIVNSLMIHRTNSVRASQLGIENEALFNPSNDPDFSVLSGQTEGSPYKRNEESLMNVKGGFYASFSSCMATCQVPVPSNLFETAERAIATLGAIATAYETYGPELRLAVLFAEGAKMDLALAAAGITASAYFGLCVGCCITAGINVLDLPSLF
jgi:hypothetical protein